ncbi:MAG: MFS transporter [Sphingopyxis granuli]|jgi:heme/copper-type cytochrome/quinol oxidase subunit 4|uniref:MFS transporter n=1 Tax=Sphingopyxis TaxID=165697 RepID=UPI000869D837|nr:MULTISPECIES: MFS transporter [Sphingopyxis]ODU28509.1 MAG: MFS transporter [Sphingopyxis sp. SCN 67-31]QUM72681.1 MFS transporter [Sphingopyxis granuli]
MAEPAAPPAPPAGGYVFKPHERPLMPGSPASPDHPLRRQIFYLLIGLYLAIVGGFQNGLLIANLTAMQGHLDLTPVDAGWVTVAYNITNACMSILLYKSRQQFGIQRFVRAVMIALLIANFVQLFDAGYRMELVARGVSGIAASGLSTLAAFYMMQGLPQKLRIAGFLLAIGLTQVAVPLARAMSPLLLADGDIANLFVFQFALSLVAVGLVNILHLPPGETMRSFEKLDLVTFPMLAVGVGLLCAFLVQGRIQWWSTPWLGGALAAAVVLIGFAFLIEHYRANPMLQTRWMGSRDLVKFALTGALVRVLTSEQNFGATGLLSTVGLVNDQLVTYYVVLTAATLLGALLAIARLDPTDLRRPTLVSLGVIAVGAWLDTHSGLRTGPVNLYFSQAAIAFAAVYFMGPMLMEGLLRALTKGPSYLVSFVGVFSLSQTLGGLAGVAALSAFHTLRTKAHLMTLGQTLATTNPDLARGIETIAAGLTGSISDPALRSATAASQVVREAAREATILAFNDVFFVIGSLAGIAFLIMLARWVYDRRRGHNPLAAELEALQKMRAANL